MMSFSSLTEPWMLRTIGKTSPGLSSVKAHVQIAKVERPES